jgi:hypothetical protein
VSEFVGNAIHLEIGDVVAGDVNAPFLEVCTNNFGVVMVILIPFVCAEWKDENERGNRLVSKIESTSLITREARLIVIWTTSRREIRNAHERILNSDGFCTALYDTRRRLRFSF